MYLSELPKNKINPKIKISSKANELLVFFDKNKKTFAFLNMEHEEATHIFLKKPHLLDSWLGLDILALWDSKLGFFRMVELQNR